MTLEEGRALIKEQQSLIGGDQWVAVGTEGNKDWMQVGTGSHHAGKSHNQDCGGYPPWGDREDEEYPWNRYALVHYDVELWTRDKWREFLNK